MQNTFQADYPAEKIKMIVVDDSSTDNTYAITSSLTSKYHNLRVLRVQRGGESPTINAGLALASTEITLTSDADVILEPKSIRNGTRWFADERVGGVTGVVNWTVGGQKTEAEMSNVRIYWSIQRLESLVDSTFFNGGFQMFRTKLIKEFPVDLFADDGGPIELRRQGKHIILDEEIREITSGPRTLKGFVGRRFRNAIGLIQALFYCKDVMFNPKMGFFGMITVPWRFLPSVVEPVLFLVLLARLGMDVIRYDAAFSLATYFGILLLLYAISPVWKKGGRQVNFLRAPLNLVAIYFVKNLARLAGMLRFAAGTRVGPFQPGGEGRIAEDAT